VWDFSSYGNAPDKTTLATWWHQLQIDTGKRESAKVLVQMKTSAHMNVAEYSNILEKMCGKK